MLFTLLSCMHHLSPSQQQTIGGDRPAILVAPAGWDATQPLPVIFLLHGLGSSSQKQDRYMRFSKLVDEQNFLLVLPDGLERSKDGKQAWNATDYCCSPDGPDDVAYLTGLMDELEGMGAEDVYFTGHSNGGFMSYRMACEVPDRIGAIAGLAGSTWLDPADCASGSPVDVLQIHGTDDTTVPYAGRPDKYPSAEDTVGRWAARAGCTEEAVEAGGFDLVLRPGEDTRRQAWRCPQPHRVELWSIDGAGHIPLVKQDYAREVVRWLLADQPQ
ncbi:MAG: polyhydroxybutyrate depolymerase [Myxococcota bacterium]|jgi:polyhydroxybutyrate depolymerase